jgi:5,10-methylene-tetrahydrofolate dehydrogenase/methenyl tetrahydrofolate cyclohydrolase
LLAIVGLLFFLLSVFAYPQDVDGFHPLNVGALVTRNQPLFVPCTPKACIELLLRSGIEIAGKRAVVLGRSLVVGTPVFHLLQSQDATVTLCHSKSPNIEQMIREADILVAAIGKPNFVQRYTHSVLLFIFMYCLFVRLFSTCLFFSVFSLRFLLLGSGSSPALL